MKKQNVKVKEYRYFNFPNELTSTEIFFYYLLEFGIKLRLKPQKLEKLGDNVIDDYLSGYIGVDTLNTVANWLTSSDFRESFQELEKVNPNLTKLIYGCTDLSYEKENKPEWFKIAVKNLKNYQKTRK